MTISFSEQAGALDPNRWAEEIQAYAAGDVISPQPNNAIVFTGSSSIALWKTLVADMTPLTVINRGFGGSTMRDALYWLGSLVLKYRPRAVVLYEGDNDLADVGTASEDILEGFSEFVLRVRAEQPTVRIYVLSIKPSILRWSRWPEMQKANDLLRKFSESHDGIRYIDVASSMFDERRKPREDIFDADGLHMNGKCYQLWTSIVKPILLQLEAAYETKPATIHDSSCSGKFESSNLPTR